MVIIGGTYYHERDENIDELLSKLDINFILKRIVKMAPTMILEVPEDPKGTFVLRVKVMLKTMEWTFKLGEPTEFSSPLGSRLVVFTEEDGNLVQRSLGPTSDGTTSIREFTEHGMIITLIHEESQVRAKRFFKRA
ncbi:uncharacterized protein LOC108678887 [Hyalella azteca]|uniref:Uncharacterized protein LOC108678887 n=1 Tax=Hyalella azteca TaxID=294128 RepID=A0A8B7PA65_HYAAZ|nr:uncharacterized protein LOC108678887 [Hyalella azteca]